jgi:hypothetical protein
VTVGIKISSDSRSGDTPGVAETPNADGVGELITPENLFEVEDRDFYDLLGSNPTKTSETINWLGSSYSGADIKVVAHLYRTRDATDTTKQQEDLALYEALKLGLSNIMPSLTSTGDGLGAIDYSAEDEFGFQIWTYARKKDLFRTRLGLDIGNQTHQQAIQTLTEKVFVDGDFRPIPIARKRKTAEGLLQIYDEALSQLQEDLKTQARVDKDAFQTLVLASLQTLSISTHRDKIAVRALGHSYVKGYTRGPRTIAGSMIFTVFYEHALLALIRAMGKDGSIWRNSTEFSSLLPDQLPPIDLTIAFANEYGAMSIEDILTEDVVNFVARDCDVMTPAGKIQLSRLQRGTTGWEQDGLSATDLLYNKTFDESYYTDYLDQIGIRRWKVNR